MQEKYFGLYVIESRILKRAADNQKQEYSEKERKERTQSKQEFRCRVLIQNQMQAIVRSTGRENLRMNYI